VAPVPLHDCQLPLSPDAARIAGASGIADRFLPGQDHSGAASAEVRDQRLVFDLASAKWATSRHLGRDESGIS
jgi:hypothetical protein